MKIKDDPTPLALATELIAKEYARMLSADPSFWLKNLPPRKPLTRWQKVKRWAHNTFTYEFSDEYESLRFIRVWRFYFLISKPKP